MSPGSGIDLVATRVALRDAASRTSALLGAVTNPSASVPGLKWTVAETAAHVVTSTRGYTGFITGERDARRYLALAAGAQTPSERAAIVNAHLLEEFAERDLARLADTMVSGIDALIASWEEHAPDELILTWNGLSMTVPTIAAALLGEQLIHGLDMARAVGADWQISRADALLVIAGVMAMVPDYVDRHRAAGLHLSYELRFRRGPRYQVAIDDGSATVGPPGERVDCWISADPVAFLLVGYGRSGQWGPTLRGKIIAGGRKPWLGVKFGQLLTSV